MQVTIGDKVVTFKVDIGGYSVIRYNLANPKAIRTCTETSHISPQSRSHSTEVINKVSFTLSYKERCCTQPVYIVKNIKNNLLGFPAIKTLNLLSTHTMVQWWLCQKPQGLHHIDDSVSISCHLVPEVFQCQMNDILSGDLWEW